MTVTFKIVVTCQDSNCVGLLLVIRHDSNAASVGDMIWQSSASGGEVPVART